MLNFAFAGKAQRGEYWRIYLSWYGSLIFATIFAIGTTIGSISKLAYIGGSFFSILGGWFFILLIMGIVGFISCLAVTVRRCNDIGINPFWSLATLVPYIGVGAVLIFGVLNSNQYSTSEISFQFGVNQNKNNPTESSLVTNSSQAHKDTQFSGEKTLSNDGYKLFLLYAYSIKRNDVLNKFICREKIFDSVEEALDFAALEEIKAEKELEAEKINDARRNELIEKQLKDQKEKEEREWAAKEPERAAQAKRQKYYQIIIFFIGIVVIASLIYFRSSQSNLTVLHKFGEGVPRDTFEKNAAKEGWIIFRSFMSSESNQSLLEIKHYKSESRPNEIYEITVDGCNPNLPEVNKNSCEGKPSFYEEVIKAEIVPKIEADGKYRTQPAANAIIIDLGDIKDDAKVNAIASSVRSDVELNKLPDYTSVHTIYGSNWNDKSTWQILIAGFKNQVEAKKYVSFFNKYGDAYFGRYED